MHKLKENAEKELRAIEEKGLTSSNIDNAHKLIEIVKGIDKIEMLEDTGYSRDRSSYYNDGRSRDYDYDNSNGYDDDNSYRRGRNSRTGQYMHRPNYSRLSGDDNMDEYRREKQRYSTSKDRDSKERMLDALELFMKDTTVMMQELFSDADCQEEREIIQRYAKKIANM